MSASRPSDWNALQSERRWVRGYVAIHYCLKTNSLVLGPSSSLTFFSLTNSCSIDLSAIFSLSFPLRSVSSSRKSLVLPAFFSLFLLLLFLSLASYLRVLAFFFDSFFLWLGLLFDLFFAVAFATRSLLTRSFRGCAWCSSSASRILFCDLFFLGLDLTLWRCLEPELLGQVRQVSHHVSQVEHHFLLLGHRDVTPLKEEPGSIQASTGRTGKANESPTARTGHPELKPTHYGAAKMSVILNPGAGSIYIHIYIYHISVSLYIFLHQSMASPRFTLG